MVPWPFRVVCGLADPEFEAWSVVAATPLGAEEEAAHTAARERLGFDPIAHPERLTSKRETDPRDAKRVLAELCATGRTAEQRWAEAPISGLRSRGASCGLTSFLDEVKESLVPMFDPRPVNPTA